MTAQHVKDLLWNDPFFIDLIYDILANRKPAGLAGAIGEIAWQA